MKYLIATIFLTSLVFYAYHMKDKFGHARESKDQPSILLGVDNPKDQGDYPKEYNLSFEKNEPPTKEDKDPKDEAYSIDTIFNDGFLTENELISLENLLHSGKIDIITEVYEIFKNMISSDIDTAERILDAYRNSGGEAYKFMFEKMKISENAADRAWAFRQLGADTNLFDIEERQNLLLKATHIEADPEVVNEIIFSYLRLSDQTEKKGYYSHDYLLSHESKTVRDLYVANYNIVSPSEHSLLELEKFLASKNNKNKRFALEAIEYLYSNLPKQDYHGQNTLTETVSRLYETVLGKPEKTNIHLL